MMQAVTTSTDRIVVKSGTYSRGSASGELEKIFSARTAAGMTEKKVTATAKTSQVRPPDRLSRIVTGLAAAALRPPASRRECSLLIGQPRWSVFALRGGGPRLEAATRS